MQRSPPPTSFSSPNLSSLSGTGENVTQRKRKQPESEITYAINSLNQDINKRLDEMKRYFDCAMSKLSDNLINIKTDLTTVTQTTTDIKNELNSLKLEHLKLEKGVITLDEKYKILTQDFDSLQKSMQYTSDQQDVLNKRVDSISEQINSADVCNTGNLIQVLEAKIDALEQQARQCNIEICNIPEKRSENLIALMESIASKIKCPLQQKDIIAIHRVPHAQNTNKAPKNIIVKLGSRILRDNILSAVRLAKGIKTDQVGISGVSQPIFLNEHLTIRNKQLFRTVRETARKNNFKYVWIKHATILVRENDSTPAMAIRSTQDISRIKPSAGVTKRN